MLLRLIIFLLKVELDCAGYLSSKLHTYSRLDMHKYNDNSMQKGIIEIVSTLAITTIIPISTVMIRNINVACMLLIKKMIMKTIPKYVAASLALESTTNSELL